MYRKLNLEFAKLNGDSLFCGIDNCCLFFQKIKKIIDFFLVDCKTITTTTSESKLSVFLTCFDSNESILAGEWTLWCCTSMFQISPRQSFMILKSCKLFSLHFSSLLCCFLFIFTLLFCFLHFSRIRNSIQQYRKQQK